MYLKYLQIQSLHIITIMSDDKFSRGSAGSTFCESCKRNTYNPRRKVCKNCRARNAKDGPLGF